MSGKYFPNNWARYKAAPDDFFEPHTFMEIMAYKLLAWELKPGICAIIRVTNSETKRTGMSHEGPPIIEEFVYKRKSAADKRIEDLITKPHLEFTVCTPDLIQAVSAHDSDSDYEPSNF